MGDVVLILVVALTAGAVIFGVITLVSGGDPGLRAVDADDRAQPLPGDRPLIEDDVSKISFDLAWRGYRMAQVDQTLRRLAYDIGYKSELIHVLEAEVAALRDGRTGDADMFAKARANALSQPESDRTDVPTSEVPDSTDLATSQDSAARPPIPSGIGLGSVPGTPAPGSAASSASPDVEATDLGAPGAATADRQAGDHAVETATPAADERPLGAARPAGSDEEPDLATGNPTKRPVIEIHLPSATGRW